MNLALCLFAAAGLGLGFAGPMQKRFTKEEPKFEELHAELAKHWEAKAFGACSESLSKMQGLVSKARRRAILASLPTPAGWTIKEDESMEQAEANPFASAMMARSARRIIGACRSVFTATTNRQSRMPCRCCEAPEIPKAR